MASGRDAASTGGVAVKALKDAAKEVRAFWARHPGNHVVSQGISAQGKRLLELIDALPDDGVTVPRERLEVWHRHAGCAYPPGDPDAENCDICDLIRGTGK